MSANRITLKQREEMFQVYSECGNVSKVAKKCKVHKKTVKRYRELDHWDARRADIESAVQVRSDDKQIGRRLRNVKALDTAIEAITEDLKNKGEIENKMLPKLIAVQEVLLGRGAADDEVPDLTPEELAALEVLKALPQGALQALAAMIVEEATRGSDLISPGVPLLGTELETTAEVLETES